MNANALTGARLAKALELLDKTKKDIEEGKVTDIVIGVILLEGETEAYVEFEHVGTQTGGDIIKEHLDDINTGEWKNLSDHG